MKKPLAVVTLKLCILVLTVGTVTAQRLDQEVVKQQNEIYKRWWGTDLEWRFDELPPSGLVAKQRMPWAGHIYPDNAGGCVDVLRKYDQAFHRGRSLAADFERRDIEIHQTTQYRRGGLFGFRTFTVRATPHWAGHCNGWTSAAIRHAEPKNSVSRNGVVFSPSDIKGLLAELYVYTDIELLGGEDEGAVHPAVFHVALANWLGRGEHPFGMDSTLGREIWNYPIYSYKSTFAKQGDRAVEVSTNIGFVNSTDREYDHAPKRYQFMYFHYQLELDRAGKIIGGFYYRDSNQVDLLWVPLQPSKGGEPGNKEGNPHLDVKEVLALWRDSVPEKDRKEWYNINPWPEDAIVDDAEEQAAGQQTVEAERDATVDSAEESGSTEGNGASAPVDAPATEPTNAN